jgi:hypothetical protein
MHIYIYSSSKFLKAFNQSRLFSSFQVPGVVSEHVVELNVVDLVSGLRLEPLVDQCEFGFAGQQLEVIENRTEACHADEARSTLVLVLVERLDQQAAVANLRAKSLHKLIEVLLFACVKHVAGVQNAGCGKACQTLGGVLLEVFLGEDFGAIFAEIYVVDERSVGGVSNAVHFLEQLVLLSSQLNFLGVQNGPELGGREDSLAEEVVVLEELKEADTVLFDAMLDLYHKVLEGLASTVVDELGSVSALRASVRSIDIKDEHVTVLKEVGVTNLVAGSAVATVDLGNTGDLSLAQEESVGGEHLAEDLGSHLEVSVTVKVLEEGLGVETVLANNLLEALNDAVDTGDFLVCGVLAAVDSIDFGVVEGNIDGSLQVFLGENSVDGVAEIAPEDVFAFLGGLKG